MLQNQPVRDLQYDSDIMIAQQPRLEPTVYPEPTNITSVRRTSLGLPRAPLPISTIEGTTASRTFLPRTGLDLLIDLPSIHIEQTCDLHDGPSIASENRYTIRSPFGDAIYAASESSTEKSRTIWGSGRAFRMHLLDKTHQEAMFFRRKFALGVLCCQPRSLEVWTPPGNLIGIVEEVSALCSSKFNIVSGENGEVVYIIEGPSVIGCCMPIDAHFRIFSHDGQTLQGSITRKWSTASSQYIMSIYFNDTNLDTKSKALTLGAAFLLEYMYFQSRF